MSSSVVFRPGAKVPDAVQHAASSLPGQLSTPPFQLQLQLPTACYFDEVFYRIEQERLFAQGPRYAGHALMVPEAGDFHVLETYRNSRMLRRGVQGISLQSNICRHRQAHMLDGHGHAPQTVCPLHRWTYNDRGELIGAPHFAENPCLHLDNTALQAWNGMLFELVAHGCDVEADLKDLGVRRELDFGGYRWHSTRVTPYTGNWKTFIEVYLEDYHVDPFHAGLGRFVDCSELRWEFGAQYSVQNVGFQALAPGGSPSYHRWRSALAAYNQAAGQPDPQHGAIWLTYYPHVMLEWYPHTLVVSTLLPQGPRRYLNICEFYYPEEVALFEDELVSAEQAAYEETAQEDAEIIARMEAGRECLYAEGRHEAGPYQSPMEDGMAHFHRYMHMRLGDEITTLARAVC